MGSEKVLFKSEEQKSAIEAAAILRKIADKVEQGGIILNQGNDKVKVDFPQNLSVEIKVEEETGKKSGKVKKSLEIELEWIVGDHDRGGMIID